MSVDVDRWGVDPDVLDWWIESEHAHALSLDVELLARIKSDEMLEAMLGRQPRPTPRKGGDRW